MSPPADPFAAVVERELIIQLMICGAYGWSCLGIALANLARKITVPDASADDTYDGKYIEFAVGTILCLRN